jgi:hypothetical protein
MYAGAFLFYKNNGGGVMKKMNMFASMLLFLSMLLPVSALDVSAQEAKYEVKASSAISDILKDRIGKRTTIRTQSGEDIEGTVVMVGNSVVHVEKLAGKEFYDAVISLDKISAVIMRVRNK